MYVTVLTSKVIIRRRKSRSITAGYRTGKFICFLVQLSSPRDHISIVFSVKLPLKLIWLKVSSAFNIGQRQQWNFPSLSLNDISISVEVSSNAVSALHASLWLVGLAEAGENRFNRV